MLEIVNRPSHVSQGLPQRFVIHNAEHGRVIEAWLTKRGHAKLQDAHQTVFGIEERMLSEMTAAGRRRLNETLRQLVENLTTS